MPDVPNETNDKIIPFTVADYKFEGSFYNESIPFKHDGCQAGITNEYMSFVRRKFLAFFESENNEKYLNTSEIQLRCRVISSFRKDIVSKKTSKPWSIFELICQCSKGEYWFARKFFSCETKQDFQKIKEFADILSSKFITINGILKRDDDAFSERGFVFNVNAYFPCDPFTEEKEYGNISKRIDLSIRTNYSPLDGVDDINDWLSFFSKNKIKFFGVSDMSGVYGWPRFENAIEKHNKNLPEDEKIVMTYGTTYFTQCDFGCQRNSFVLRYYARTDAGKKLLYEKITKSHQLSSDFAMPTFSWQDAVELSQHDGVIVVLPTSKGILTHAMAHWKSKEDVEKLMSELAGVVDYVEFSPVDCHMELLSNLMYSSGIVYQHSIAQERLVNILRDIKNFAIENKIPILFSNSPRYIDRETSICREAALFSNKIVNYDSEDIHFLNFEEIKNKMGFLFSRDEMIEVLLKNPIVFMQSIEKFPIVPEGLFLPKINCVADTDKFLVDKTEEGIAQMYGESWRFVLPKDIVERIDFELESICKKYSVIYVASYLAIKKSEELGFSVGSRGSVGSSAVAFFSGISEVNPLRPHYYCTGCNISIWDSQETREVGVGIDMPDKACPKCGDKMAKDGWNIQFSTFMGYDGSKVADIDLNFAGSVQGKVMKYISRELFPTRAFRAGTVMKLKESGQLKAFKNLFGCNYAKNVVLASKTIGMRKAIGKHAGGIVIIPEDKEVSDFTPLSRVVSGGDLDGDSGMSTHFEFEVIHDTLLKMDILGSDSIEFLEMLSMNTGVPHRRIEWYEKEVLEIFQKGDTLGVNEFTTGNAIDMLEEVKPTKWQHLCSMSGLQHGTGVWGGNARNILLEGTATIDSIDGCRDEIVEKLTVKLGDGKKAYDIVESVRKGRGVPKEFTPELSKKVPGWYLEFLNKIQYMFPKAHAAAYLQISAKQAWYKLHYPAHFYATYLSIKAKFIEESWCFSEITFLEKEIERFRRLLSSPDVENKIDKQKKIVTCMVLIECKQRGFVVKEPHVNESMPDRFAVKNNILYSPLVTIASVGEKTAQVIYRERLKNGLFKDMEDLYTRTSIQHESMRCIGNYDNFGSWGEEKKKQGDFLRRKRKLLVKEEESLIGRKNTGQRVFDFFSK
jgi:DNA polymerase-3 subunit alpha (Gram-positive type)